jgi:hypothetical protein
LSLRSAADNRQVLQSLKLSLNGRFRPRGEHSHPPPLLPCIRLPFSLDPIELILRKVILQTTVTIALKRSNNVKQNIRKYVLHGKKRRVRELKGLYKNKDLNELEVKKQSGDDYFEVLKEKGRRV